MIDIRLSDCYKPNLNGRIANLVSSLGPASRKFNTFWKKNIPVTDRYYSIENLRLSPPKGDVYLVGSDQVWNPEITGALLDGCVSTLEKHGALPENIHVKTVPGSFELVYGAHQMTLNDGYDAVIILGSVIRGETPHFDYICQGVTEGIARLNATSNIPVVFGLLTTNDLQQARDRAGGKHGNKGDECAVVAIKMAKF
jgi:6,7-dimethyl-8-ribityllumazine synthase